MVADTIPSRLLEQARLRPNAPAYKIRENGVWKATSWAGYADEVKRVGRALIALGFEPGQHTCILGFNRPEWTIFDVATMAVGGAPRASTRPPRPKRSPTSPGIARRRSCSSKTPSNGRR